MPYFILMLVILVYLFQELASYGKYFVLISGALCQSLMRIQTPCGLHRARAVSENNLVSIFKIECQFLEARDAA